MKNKLLLSKFQGHFFINSIPCLHHYVTSSWFWAERQLGATKEGGGWSVPKAVYLKQAMILVCNTKVLKITILNWIEGFLNITIMEGPLGWLPKVAMAKIWQERSEMLANFGSKLNGCQNFSLPSFSNQILAINQQSQNPKYEYHRKIDSTN